MIMVIALYLVALAMIGGGGWAVYEGYGIVLTERGWSMVIAGTVAATGGVLVLAAAILAGRLGRIHGELVRLRERVGRLDAATPPRPGVEPLVPPAGVGVPGAGPVEQAVLKAADVIPEPAREPVRITPERAPVRAAPPLGEDEESLAYPPAAPEADAPAVVGTYNSGGNAYVMYADGSIEADTPTGRYRFKSLDELKDFISGRGEEGPAPAA
jgi:hypothetical protein